MLAVGSNIPSLQAQRRLGQASKMLGDVSTRLASGLRINRASDDAAGLAVSAGLNVDARVYSQGIKNVNDMLGLLDIAEGSAQELRNITIRQIELAEQAANGVYSNAQRTALDREANALVAEYNRIVQTTSFNDLELLDLSVETFTTQAGYGINGTLSLQLGRQMAGLSDSGTYQDETVLSGLGTNLHHAVGDMNGDGHLDVVTFDNATSNGFVFRGNGDGTFRAPLGASFATGVTGVTIIDLNGDGKLDVLSADDLSAQVRVHFGTGTGGFSATVSLNIGSGPNSAIGDVDEDGDLDVVTSAGTSIGVGLSNGNGTITPAFFEAPSTVGGMTLADVNSDGHLDMVYALIHPSDRGYGVKLGNGNGTFRATVSRVLATQNMGIPHIGDINGDGKVDLVGINSSNNGLYTFFGQNDGTFSVQPTYASTGALTEITLVDADDDGILDVLGSNGRLFLGNGNGSFRQGTILPATGAPTLQDLNGDGVRDLLMSSGSGQLNVMLGIGRQSTEIDSLDLSTATTARAALTTLREQLTRITSELGSIGAYSSRLSVAVNTMSVSKENYIAAGAQILDADFSVETSRLVAAQILQQSAVAIVGQANQLPALALRLLGG